MGSERQSLPHGLRKETRNIKPTTTTLQSTKTIGSHTRILFHTRCLDGLDDVARATHSVVIGKIPEV